MPSESAKIPNRTEAHRAELQGSSHLSPGRVKNSQAAQGNLCPQVLSLSQNTFWGRGTDRMGS